VRALRLLGSALVIEMWNWIVLNKQWLFSGVGVSILAAGWWFLKKLGFFGSFVPPAAVQTNTNSVIQSPVINVNVPLPSPASEPKPDTQTRPALPAPRALRPDPKIEEEPDLRPKIYSLEPRIIDVSEVDPEEGTGIIEGGDLLRAVVATFRMKKPSADGHTTYLTARLSYRTVEDNGLRGGEKEIHRVNYGTWLDEEFNFVEMTITDTKELVLAMQAKGSDVCVAVQDKRHSTSRYNGLAYHNLEPNGESFFVDVTLVDGNHGPITAYSYKIDVDPLKVHEIIRVPKVF
jgi:hypothetical protein